MATRDLSEEDEKRRLQALALYRVLDSAPEQGYDDVTRLAAFICGTPISLVSFVDKDRQWFKSEHGLGASETPRSQSFCANTIARAEMLIVEDARADVRFRDNPLVLGKPNIRFYAGAPLVDENGQVLGTVCVIDTQPRVLSESQITSLQALARQVMVLLEQRKAIARLKEAATAAEAANRVINLSERRLQSFVDTFPALAWMANVDGWITWYNRRWYQYTGTTPEQMEGWGWQSVHDPAVLSSVLERWKESIETQQPFEMVFPLRGADGIMRSFLTRVVPVRDEQGAVVEWFGTNTEIDELQRTRRALEISEAELQQAMNATSDAIVSIHSDWKLTYLNPAAERLYGVSKDLIGRNFWQAFPGQHYTGSPFINHYYLAMNEKVAGSFEAGPVDPLNVTMRVEVYPTPDGIVTFSRDVTKLKHAAAAVLQNEKLAAVGRLASSIAHEINNPLESVTNLLYLARRTSDSAVLDQYLDTAERELRRVSAITNQTLGFYKQTTRPQSVSCVDLFARVLALFQGRLMNANIQVEKRKRATRPAFCLEGEISQVCGHIVANAIDAMSAGGGRLLLRSREATSWTTGEKGLALTIADTGKGMPVLVRKMIFDAFFSTKGIGGTGLGLWVSKEIIDRHRGTIRVWSSDRPTAHGSVFVIFLPFETAEWTDLRGETFTPTG